MTTLKSLVTIMAVAFVALTTTAVPAQAAAPMVPPTVVTAPTGVEGAGDMARCLVATIKRFPDAKKFAPREYQRLEQRLTNAFNASKGMQLTQAHLRAIFTGAQVGKFIGYDLVYFIGAVQYCWPELRK